MVQKVLLMSLCAITRLKAVILISESLLYHLVQEPSSYVVPGLRYEGKYKLRLIIGTVRYQASLCYTCITLAIAYITITKPHYASLC